MIGTLLLVGAGLFLVKSLSESGIKVPYLLVTVDYNTGTPPRPDLASAEVPLVYGERLDSRLTREFGITLNRSGSVLTKASPVLTASQVVTVPEGLLPYPTKQAVDQYCAPFAGKRVLFTTEFGIVVGDIVGNIATGGLAARVVLPGNSTKLIPLS